MKNSPARTQAMARPSTERGDLIVVWYEGTGAYEGLSYFFMSDSLEITAGITSVWRVRSQIFPGDPPTLYLGEALLSRIEVPGAREATIHLPDAAVAHGFAAASRLSTGPPEASRREGASVPP